MTLGVSGVRRGWVAGIFFAAGAVMAQGYPVKPIRMIVPFAPGGPNDLLARLAGQKITEQLHQPVVIENRGGAGGTVGLDAAARAAGDGYTLSMGGSSNMAVAPSLYAKLPYDPVRDFTPIINIAHVPYAVAVNPTVPAKNAKELVVAARAKGLSYGSSGAGSMSSLAAELFKSMAKANIVHVPYKGTAPALTDVMSGQIDMMFADLALIQPHVMSNRLRVLAVCGSKRLAGAPNIPTIAESVFKGYVIEPWFGVVGPANVPREIVLRLNQVLNAGLKSVDSQQRLTSLGYEVIGGSAQEFEATIKSDIAAYARIIKSAGIKGE